MDEQTVTIRLYARWDQRQEDCHSEAAEERGLLEWYATLGQPYTYFASWSGREETVYLKRGLVTVTVEQAKFLLEEAIYGRDYNTPNKYYNKYGCEDPDNEAYHACIKTIRGIEAALKAVQ